MLETEDLNNSVFLCLKLIDIPFSYSDLELEQKTKAQCQDIWTGHKPSLCLILASNNFL